MRGRDLANYVRILDLILLGHTPILAEHAVQSTRMSRRERTHTHQLSKKSVETQSRRQIETETATISADSRYPFGAVIKRYRPLFQAASSRGLLRMSPSRKQRF